MPSNITISSAELLRSAGLATAPDIIDVRIDEDFDADPRLVPVSRRRDHRTAASWARDLAGRDVVVVCQKGLKLSHGTAAWLRHAGARAVSLEGGFEAWRDLGAPLMPNDLLPPRDQDGRTVWVTRTRPKVDRIACPWLIRRFIDPHAVFLFVAAGEVGAVGERFGATPFDVEGACWGHRGERCTFDAIVADFGLSTPALDQLAVLVRAADTARLDLAPEAAGLLAASRGLSLLHEDDLQQLEAGLGLYDALYQWCIDQAGETVAGRAIADAA